MLPPSRVLFKSIRLGLLLASIDLVLGQDSSGRLDILRGTRGESACTLQDNIVGKCTTSTRRDSSPSFILDRGYTLESPVPSACTCNTIFFNIWSACCYSTGNSTLPNFTQWTQTCRTTSISIQSSTAFFELQGHLGIDVPSWASLTVPGNMSFDLQRAVSHSLSTSSRCTTLKIVPPIAVVVIILFISGVVFLIYRRKCSRGGSRMGWPKGSKWLQLHSSHKVTSSFERHDSWEIDKEYETSTNLPFDHPSPKKNILNFNTEKPQIGSHVFRKPLCPPWKRKPRQIRLVPATSFFRVDAVESKGIYTSSGQTNNEEEVNEQVDDSYIYVSPEDEEGTDLIPDNEREGRNSQEVILISKGGRQFTSDSRSTNTTSVNSHIKIVSPSASSTSPRSTMHAVPAKPTLYIPIPPPPPSHAAPAPPIMPRRAERPSGSDRKQSSSYFLPHSFLSPIREASPSQSYVSDGSIRRRPALRDNRPSSNPAGVFPSCTYSPPPTSTRLPLDYVDLHRTVSRSPEVSIDVESEAYYDPYTDMTANGPYRGLPVDDSSDASIYCISPEPGQMHPARTLSPSTTDPAAFFPGAVRGALREAGYPRMYPQQEDPF